MALDCTAIFEPIQAPPSYVAAGIAAEHKELLWLSREAAALPDGTCKRILGREVRNLETGDVELRACNCDGIVIACEPTRDFFADPDTDPPRVDTGNVVMQKQRLTMIHCGDFLLPYFEITFPSTLTRLISFHPKGEPHGHEAVPVSAAIAFRILRGLTVAEQCAMSLDNTMTFAFSDPTCNLGTNTFGVLYRRPLENELRISGRVLDKDTISVDAIYIASSGGPLLCGPDLRCRFGSQFGTKGYVWGFRGSQGQTLLEQEIRRNADGKFDLSALVGLSLPGITPDFPGHPDHQVPGTGVVSIGSLGLGAAMGPTVFNDSVEIFNRLVIYIGGCGTTECGPNTDPAGSCGSAMLSFRSYIIRAV